MSERIPFHETSVQPIFLQNIRNNFYDLLFILSTAYDSCKEDKESI